MWNTAAFLLAQDDSEDVWKTSDLVQKLARKIIY